MGSEKACWNHFVSGILLHSSFIFFNAEYDWFSFRIIYSVAM